MTKPPRGGVAYDAMEREDVLSNLRALALAAACLLAVPARAQNATDTEGRRADNARQVLEPRPETGDCGACDVVEGRRVV